MSKLFYYYIFSKKNIVIYLISFILVIFCVYSAKDTYLDVDFISKNNLYNFLEQSLFFMSLITIVLAVTTMLIHTSIDKMSFDIMIYNKQNKRSIIVTKINTYLSFFMFIVLIELVILISFFIDYIYVINNNEFYFIIINYIIFIFIYLLLTFLVYNVFRNSYLLVSIIIIYFIVYFLQQDNIINQILIFDSYDFEKIRFESILIVVILYFLNIFLYIKKSLKIS